MKKLIPYTFLLIGILIIAKAVTPPRYGSDFDVRSFAELPVQSGGRILPLDSVARNTLRIISGRQTARLPEDGGKIPAILWFMELSFNPVAADAMPIFRIDNAEVLGLFGWQQEDRKYFAFDELRPHFHVIQEQASNANPEPQLRSVFEKQLLKLFTSLNSYDQLSRDLHAGGNLDQILLEYGVWEHVAIPGREAFDLRERGQPFDEEAFDRFTYIANRYLSLSQTADLGITPPVSEEDKIENDWLNIGETLLMTIQTGEINPIAQSYADLTIAWRTGDTQAFNQTLAKLRTTLDAQAPVGRVAFEEFVNTFEPFYQASILYVIIFLLACFSWLCLPVPLQRAAFLLLVLTFAVHSLGLFSRMYIQGRPPVTNLYSSAIFVGWGAVLLGIILERIYRNGIGSFVSGLVGFITLVIAHNLAKTGDTLEMMQAVLDSNFWLATHVVIITIGYSAMFLAGALAIVYVIRRLPENGLPADTASALYRMVYGITCFGLLFSFVGTMLGGIWADQSWGRFWGWDPKENGALIIVLWSALMLHARIGRVCGERGFMLLAIGGNIVTAWSWFGTNMLGIGLHSYGFMDSAFFWLIFFVASQFALIALGFTRPAKREPAA